VYAQGSEMMPQPAGFGVTEGRSKQGMVCNEENLTNNLVRANYEFEKQHPGGAECGVLDGGSGRRLDSDSEQENVSENDSEDSDDDMSAAEWALARSASCAEMSLPALCFASFYLRDSEGYQIFLTEHADEALCCWQMGCPPEDYYLAPAGIGYYSDNPYAIGTGLRRRGTRNRRLEDEDVTSLVIKARSHKEHGRRAEWAAEHEESTKDNRWTKPTYKKSAALTASLQQLGGTGGEGAPGGEDARRLDSDADDGSDADGAATGPFKNIYAALVNKGPKDYDCTNHWKVRSDILAVLDQSPWFYDSYCYVFASASLGADPYLSTSTSTFLDFPKNNINHRRRSYYSERNDPAKNEYRASNMWAAVKEQWPDQCRQMPVYLSTFDDGEFLAIDVSPGRGPSLCDAGIYLRSDSSWVVAMLTMAGPMKCCAKSAVAMSSEEVLEGSEIPE